jgi:hypothetical protein
MEALTASYGFMGWFMGLVYGFNPGTLVMVTGVSLCIAVVGSCSVFLSVFLSLFNGICIT